MESVLFHLIDVFSTKAYRGNPLAIVMDPKSSLTDGQMKLIARQFNLSETTFILPPTNIGADYRLRSFLPNGREVFGAGHNILGGWWFLAQAQELDFSRREPNKSVAGKTEYTFHQELGDAVIPVTIIKENANGVYSYSVALRQAAPKAHGYHQQPESLAATLGVLPNEIGFAGKDGALLKPRVMSTSTTHHLLVPVSSVAVLETIVMQREKILEELASVDKAAFGMFFFTPLDSIDSETRTYKARFFSPGMSSEDPATGSAAGPLSAYLYQHNELETSNGVAKINVSQGHTVGRDCVIEVQLKVKQAGSLDDLNVDIVGGGVMVGNGQLNVPDRDILF